MVGKLTIAYPGHPKGQLISKELFGILNSSKMNEKILLNGRLNHYDTSDTSIFFEEFDNTQNTFFWN